MSDQKNVGNLLIFRKAKTYRENSSFSDSDDARRFVLGRLADFAFLKVNKCCFL